MRSLSWVPLPRDAAASRLRPRLHAHSSFAINEFIIRPNRLRHPVVDAAKPSSKAENTPTWSRCQTGSLLTSIDATLSVPPPCHVIGGRREHSGVRIAVVANVRCVGFSRSSRHLCCARASPLAVLVLAPYFSGWLRRWHLHLISVQPPCARQAGRGQSGAYAARGLMKSAGGRPIC